MKSIDRAIDILVERRFLVRRASHGYEFIEYDLQNVSSFKNERFPSGPIIPLIYQINLLTDELRIKNFILFSIFIFLNIVFGGITKRKTKNTGRTSVFASILTPADLSIDICVEQKNSPLELI
jgi:hypothetical protein